MTLTKTKKLLEKHHIKHIRDTLMKNGYLSFKINERFSSGVPDLLILLGKGLVFFGEVKREGTPLTPLQEHHLDLIAARGGLCGVFWGQSDGIVLVETWSLDFKRCYALQDFIERYFDAAVKQRP